MTTVNDVAEAFVDAVLAGRDPGELLDMIDKIQQLTEAAALVSDDQLITMLDHFAETLVTVQLISMAAVVNEAARRLSEK
jgi:hypothetical protein